MVDYTGHDGVIRVDGSRVADVVHWTVTTRETATGLPSWTATVDIKGDAAAIGEFMVTLPALELECWDHAHRLSGNALTRRAEIHRNRLQLVGNGPLNTSDTPSILAPQEA